MARLSVLCFGCLYLPQDTPSTNFCYRLSQPQGHSVARRIKSLKNPNDPLRDWTHSLPYFSAVLWASVPLHTPFEYYTTYNSNKPCEWWCCQQCRFLHVTMQKMRRKLNDSCWDTYLLSIEVVQDHAQWWVSLLVDSNFRFLLSKLV